MPRRFSAYCKMYYYDPNDKRPFRWAAASAAAYVLSAAVAFACVSFDLDAGCMTGDGIVVEFVEAEPVPPPEPPEIRIPEPQMHDKVSAEENEQQVSGTDEQTRTVNPKALFKMNRGGTDAPESVGNPKARKAEENTASGAGGGLNPEGNDQLDKGLQGRGLVGALPRPAYPGNLSGKIVIRVAVDKNGRVTSAEFEPAGSTLNDGAMVQAAIEAAKKARFTESRSFIEGGTITYNFNLN